MDRITNTNKWKDDWFLDLSPNGKLIFMFLCDNCDNAGFFSLSTKHMNKYLNLPPKTIVESVRELGDKIVFNKKRKKVWIKNFLFYQNQLPLENKNVEHNKIKLVLEKNLNDFEENGDILFIIQNQISVKSKRVKKFTKPLIDEVSEYVKEYISSEEIEVSNDIAKQFFNHYQSNGWKVGKNQMKDWKATIRNWIGRDVKSNNPSNKEGKIEKIKNANSVITDVNVD